jgi:S-adenosylmethionine hydrolase
MLATGNIPASSDIETDEIEGRDWPEDLERIVYVDHYGNLITGMRAGRLHRDALVRAGHRDLRFARTFCEVAPGTAFWYENAFGLLELAVNQGEAGRLLGLRPGDAIEVR